MSKKIGEKIRKLRLAYGLTQGEIAELLGLAQNTISDKETGQASFKIEELNKLAMLFDVTVDDLISDKELTVKVS